MKKTTDWSGYDSITIINFDYKSKRSCVVREDECGIVINQCGRNETENFKYKKKNISWISLNEYGIGLSRNTAIMEAKADICLFADDDIIYNTGYEKDVINAFEECPDADIIIFNINSKDGLSNHFKNTRMKRIRLTESLKYGGPRIAIRLDSLRKANLFFSLLYGGGARYSAGEDSLFLVEAFRKNLKVYVSSVALGEIDDSESTWFEGYTDKYYIDRGYWLANAFPKFKYPLGVYYAHRLRKSSERSFSDILKLILRGINKFND